MKRAWLSSVLVSGVFLICTHYGLCPRAQEEGTADGMLDGTFLYRITHEAKLAVEIQGKSATGVGGPSITVIEPRVKWYSKKGTVLVEADKAYVKGKGEEIYFEKDVSALCEDWGELSCEKLYWAKGEKRIRASGMVVGKFYRERYKK